MDRREFLISGSAVACACLLCPYTAQAAKDAPEPVDLGPLADLTDAEITDRWAEGDGFFLIRRDNRLYALSAYCTHKRVRLTVRDEKLKCARHGSIFNLVGDATKGPAKKPLTRLGIRRDDRGHVIVDRSKKFKKEQWSDPDASLNLQD